MADKTSTEHPSPAEVDPYADDPFFRRVNNPTWNACIGKQGHEENYLDGYIEAAIELAGAVIDKNMFEKRDTLVLPILYNARHALELALKFATDRFAAAGLMPRGRVNHNIKDHWNSLHAASPGDRALLQTIEALKPFVDSLSRIDNDGQELRYHTNRSHDPSLADHFLANLQIIRISLAHLAKHISALKHRTIDFLEERTTGACTNRCSRSDLLAIAHLLPQRTSWSEPEFDERKAIIKKQFNLGDRQFSKALDTIQANREMKAIIGVESNLLHTSDDDVVWTVSQWRRLHPPREEDPHDLGIMDFLDPSTIDRMIDSQKMSDEVSAKLRETLTLDQLAEIEAMFYLGRDLSFPECHEEFVSDVRREYSDEKSLAKISHLMEKTNFRDCLQASATRLGRISLAARLTAL